MDLLQFRALLEGKLPKGNRPFICKGSPRDCKVFIVGCNPATKEVEFDPYFSNEGFHYDQWYEEYLAVRKRVKDEARKHKKSGDQKDNRKEPAVKPSPTRRKITLISEALEKEGIHALETNVYSKPTKSKNLLSPADKDTTVFYFLLETIQPLILFIHGRDAQRVIEKKINKPLSSNGWYKIGEKEFYCVVGRHLSYQYSLQQAEDTGNNLAALWRQINEQELNH